MKTNKKIFSKLSLWWVETDIFRQLNYSEAGKNIAILKTIIAVGLVSDFDTRQSKVSYSELEDITGLSRPMISASLNWLIEEGLLKLSSKSHGRTNVYELVELKDDVTWTKLPYQPILKNLKVISNRGVKALTALKNYLMILKYRDNKYDVMKINHSTLIEKGNLRPNLVKAGNDLLLNADLIGLGRYVARNGQFKTSSNMYHIKGLFFGQKGIQQQSHFEDDHLFGNQHKRQNVDFLNLLKDHT